MPDLYRLEDVEFAYPGRTPSGRTLIDRTSLGRTAPVIAGLTRSFKMSQFNAILGPNGAGKSTLLRLLAGGLQPTQGNVLLEEKHLTQWSGTELARSVAVVSADAPPPGVRLDVRSYVELGRTPFVGSWAALSPADEALVDTAISDAGLSEYVDRDIADLSSGERQRAKLARAFAQEPSVLLLDEPTTHLDYRHALWVFETLRSRVVDEGLSVVCTTHDVHLASRYADYLVLLHRGSAVASGTPDTVLRSSILSKVYECDIRVDDLGELGRSILPVWSSER